MLGYLSADIICSEKRTVFRERNVQGRISEHILAPNEGYCVHYPSNVFRNKRSFENWGISIRYFPVLAGEYPVTWRIWTSRARAKIFDGSIIICNIVCSKDFVQKEKKKEKSSDESYEIYNVQVYTHIEQLCKALSNNLHEQSQKCSCKNIYSRTEKKVIELWNRSLLKWPVPVWKKKKNNNKQKQNQTN